MLSVYRRRAFSDHGDSGGGAYGGCAADGTQSAGQHQGGKGSNHGLFHSHNLQLDFFANLGRAIKNDW